MKTVVVGVSGGVDSAVAAHLLKQQGYKVYGVFMDQFGHEPEQADARAVCATLEIPFHVVDYRSRFQSQVIDRYQRERQGDVTPNPCCWCNPQVKFKCLMDYAEQIGADMVATGHYAQIIDGQLCRGVDVTKDQSYFLCGLSPQQLARIIFPLGGMTKTAVRALAQQIGLMVHNKPDSNDLCFAVPKGGPTIGQGLKQGGQPAKLYYLGQGKIGPADDPALYRQTVNIKNFNTLIALDSVRACTAKVRYRQTDQPCQIVAWHDDQVTIKFTAPVRAVTPGQWCVLYDGARVIGGGEIV